jgi:hypothetical protein
MRETYKILVRKHEGKRQLEKLGENEWLKLDGS